MLRIIETAGVTSCVAAAAIGLLGCASGLPPVSRASLTSAELSTQYADASSRSIRVGSYDNALELADEGVALKPDSAWAHYDRAVALHHLMRTNDAIAAYRLAQSLFPRDDIKGRSIAIYGVARALEDAGRCTGASDAYAEFAAFIESSAPAAARMARSYAKECGQPHPRAGDATASLAWLDYNRGVALSDAGRTDEAVRAFEAAAGGFAADEGVPRAGNTSGWGKSIAVYGVARALDNAGRCSEAIKAYQEYATLAPDRARAGIALATSKKCKPLVRPSVQTTR